LIASQTEWDRSLTGLRGIAASWVMLFHMYPFVYPHAIRFPGTDVEIHWLATGGSVGVWILYTLCAFLLARPFLSASSPPSMSRVKNYLARRFWRILPPLWVQIAILAIIAHIFSWSSPTLIDVLPYALLLQNVWPSPAPALNGVWWTLPVEFNFYLLLPMLCALLFAAMKRSRLVTCVALIACSILIELLWRRYQLDRLGPARVPELVILVGQLPGVLSCFIAGFVCAAIVSAERQARASIRKADVTFVLGAVIVLSSMWIGHLNFQTYWSGSFVYYISSPVTALGSACLIWGCYARSRIATLLLSNRIVHALGVVSYSLYLWHPPMIEWWIRAFSSNTTEGSRAWFYAFAVIASTILVSTISYWLIERPSLRAMSRLRSAPAAAIQAA
jgi:peptidoglycan/LPS O-acetylase OafA/YrhL